MVSSPERGTPPRKQGEPKMAVTVSTTEFEFSHGKAPRGYGCWAFFFDHGDEPQFFTGNYSAAKKAAVAYAVAKKHTVVRVGP